MSPLSEHDEADREDLIDLAKYLASERSVFLAPELNTEELAIARGVDRASRDVLRGFDRPPCRPAPADIAGAGDSGIARPERRLACWG